MCEEFAVYGLPRVACLAVGALKIGIALSLLIGIGYPKIAAAASVPLAILMLSAVFFHLKVRDPMTKSIPALVMLALAILIFELN